MQSQANGQRALREQSEAVTSMLRESLSPARLPEVPGAEIAALIAPASRFGVGGDFYDCFELATDRWALMIGDVAGKGPEAATVTAMLRYTARTAAIAGLLPSDVVSIANQVLSSAAENGPRFATLIFMEISRKRDGFAVKFARAGHPPPLVTRHGEVSEGSLQPGLPLGALSEARFRTQSFTLGHGDSLCLYTDGLTEARVGQDFVGVSPLIDLLRKHRGRSAQEIVDAIEGFAGRAIVRDDVAAMVFKVAEAP